MYTLRRHACLVLIAGFTIVTAPFLAQRALGADAPPATASHPVPWSFSPICPPQPPTVHQKDWPINPIDSFVLGKLETRGLSPAPRADRLTLLRRACFDLTGLPPTLKQIDAFTHDDRPDAYERLIEDLLASPAYGERWARHWLDTVRYADTSGFEKDHLYPNAWKYRDYVIRSFNSNKPFDRFIQEQIAGDELWPNDKDAVIATALFCIGPALDESALISTQLEYEWMTDCADTTGATFLGLTLGCARCHDHKYDPISQSDYYSVQAIFADSDRPYPADIRKERIKGLNGLLSDGAIPKKYLDDPRCTIETEGKTGFHLFHRPTPMEIHVLHRGQLSTPRERVGPNVPQILESSSTKGSFERAEPDQRRAILAKWITSPTNPLTARVLVNRVWAWHFGEGLVRTPNDFGNQGEPPTHPQLLDFLARDLLDHGWDLKRLQKQIMLSATYQMQSIADAQAIKVDPENRLLSHFPRQRLDGESIRDNILACAGTLNPRQFGPAIVPPLGKEELAGLFDAGSKWPITKDASQHTRRSIYLLSRRTFVLPLFAAFDAPDSMTSCPRRFTTVVPTQALTLLNSPFAVNQSKAMAKHLNETCEKDSSKEIATAWRVCFGRPITTDEAQKAEEFLKQRTEALGDNQAALAELCLALFNANEFVYVD